MRDLRPGVDGGNPESDAPALSDALALAVFGDAPHGRVVIEGELDLLTAPRLEQLLTKLLHAGYRQLGVDASGVRFLAAAGLTVLLRASCRYREAGGQLQLLAIPAPVQRVLTISRFDAGLNPVQPNGDKPATATATRRNGAGTASRPAATGASPSPAAGRSPEPEASRPEAGRS